MAKRLVLVDLSAGVATTASKIALMDLARRRGLVPPSITTTDRLRVQFLTSKPWADLYAVSQIVADMKPEGSVTLLVRPATCERPAHPEDVFLVEDLGLRGPTERRVRRAGIETIDQLVVLSEEEISEIEDIGPARCREIIERLKDKGLKPRKD